MGERARVQPAEPTPRGGERQRCGRTQHLHKAGPKAREGRAMPGIAGRQNRPEWAFLRRKGLTPEKPPHGHLEGG